jgi:VWFA-related protein
MKSSLAYLVAIFAAVTFSIGRAQVSPNSAPAAQNGGIPTLKVTTRLVVLDVVVTDKKGNLIDRLLTKDDFTILENGQAQTIRTFEPPSMHKLPAGEKPIVNSAADLAKIGDAPVTILVLDELNSRFEDMSFSRQMMLKYLQEQPTVLRQPTVLMIAENRSFSQLHDYTQNRDELIDVVKKHMPEYPWRMMRSTKGGPGALERIAQVMAALQQIAQASSGTRGRKNLIWVGNGFPTANLINSDEHDTQLLLSAMRRCTSRLLAARVTMYSIDPRPGTSSTLDIETPDDLDMAVGDTGADPLDTGQISFSNFAPSTGGIAYTGRNDLNNVIAEGIAKGENYYTMSYRPTAADDSAAPYRNISIVMKDRTLSATTRKGYYPDAAADLNPLADKTMTAQQATANLQLDLSGALTSTIAYNGLAVTATKSSAGQYSVHVADTGLEWSAPDPDGTQHGECTVAAAWYDAKGKLIGHIAQEDKLLRGAGNGGLTLTVPLALPANAVRLRFVVRDALSARMGTADLKN